MDQTLALLTVRDFVCAVCWGDLEWRPDKQVLCKQYGDQHQGHVTRYYVEERKRQDRGDALEACHLLKKIGVIEDPHKGKSADQLIHELGF